MTICARCPARQSCLASAVLWSVDGIWAGTTTRDRQHAALPIRAGIPITDVLAATLEHAEGRLRRRQQLRRRDWFHTEPSAARTESGTAA